MDEQLHTLSEYLVSSCDRLEFTIATNCRCMSCWSFKTIDTDDIVTYEADTLSELVSKLPVNA